MVKLSLYFNIHDFFKIRNYRVFDIGNNNNYFDFDKSKYLFEEKNNQIYTPVIDSLIELANNYKEELKLVFMITGSAFEHLEKYTPQVIEKLQQLNNTCQVEFISQPYYNSLSFLTSKDEFEQQIEMHTQIIKKYFNKTPQVIINTPEAIFSNDIASSCSRLGFKAILADAKSINKEEKSNYTHSIKNNDNMSALLFNSELSDLIHSHDFSEVINKLNDIKVYDDINQIVNLYVDVDNLKQDNSVHNFTEFISTLLNDEKIKFALPTDTLNNVKREEHIDVDYFVSRSNKDTSLNQFLNNKMQKGAINELFEFEKKIKESENKDLINSWRRLTGIDHLKMMSTRHYRNGDVENYKGCHETPYDTYINFMNILKDFSLTIKLQEKQKLQEEMKQENQQDQNFKDRSYDDLNNVKEAALN